MKMQLLYEFISLSKQLNFTLTAQKMNITQPVLSRHMKSLEDQFGVALFKRDTHSVELTSAGELFAVEAGKIIHQYEESLSTINAFTGHRRKNVSIAFLGEALRGVLVPFIGHFQKNFNDINVELRDSELDEALRALDEHTCDMSFLIRPNFIEPSPKFNHQHIKTDTLCVAVNRHHPLAYRKKVSLMEVVKWPLIRVDPAHFPMSADYSTGFLNCYDIPFTLYREYPNLKTCCFNLEFNNQVVLLMPTHRQYLLSGDCVAMELEEDDYWFELEVVWNKDNTNPCTQLVLKELKKFLQKSHYVNEEAEELAR
ncbi:LysR family transcriptional regulator [Vibrio ziniensis]|uniref:LysR family transcriptional regulator n=1 Tax=Vibrio ziniensis TaxID=2711221 RepID=A0A6G7CQJ9_9VIBR|nr:LysR substrate-binding domain-containing protein [Vibrio ziniensis]QIH44333.1 LysR family transcriptional regulator [Vibrio ziniensis]